MPRKNVFVIGLNEPNLPSLKAIPDAQDYEFHQLLTIEELQVGEVSVAALLEKAQRQLDAFDGSIDAIVGYWDFPVSTLVPILSERYGTTSTSLESVVKCEHKYWKPAGTGEGHRRAPAFRPGGPGCGAPGTARRRAVPDVAQARPVVLIGTGLRGEERGGVPGGRRRDP